jgi:hypothetical protein
MIEFNTGSVRRGGFRAWSKEQGLGPCRAGVHGFKSHPPHYLSFFSVYDAVFNTDFNECGFVGDINTGRARNQMLREGKYL